MTQILKGPISMDQVVSLVSSVTESYCTNHNFINSKHQRLIEIGKEEIENHFLEGPEQREFRRRYQLMTTRPQYELRRQEPPMVLNQVGSFGELRRQELPRVLSQVGSFGSDFAVGIDYYCKDTNSNRTFQIRTGILNLTALRDYATGQTFSGPVKEYQIKVMSMNRNKEDFEQHLRLMTREAKQRIDQGISFAAFKMISDLTK